MKPKIGDFIKFELKSEANPGFVSCVMGEIVHDWEGGYVVLDPWKQKIFVHKDHKFRKIHNVFFAYRKKGGKVGSIKRV